MMKGRNPRTRWIVFAACELVGLVFAAFLFMGLAMSECLPRDGSPGMNACDITKQREFWLFPTLVAVWIGLATVLEVRRSTMGKVLATLSGVMALCSLAVV